VPGQGPLAEYCLSIFLTDLDTPSIVSHCYLVDLSLTPCPFQLIPSSFSRAKPESATVSVRIQSGFITCTDLCLVSSHFCPMLCKISRSETQLLRHHHHHHRTVFLQFLRKNLYDRAAEASGRHLENPEKVADTSMCTLHSALCTRHWALCRSIRLQKVSLGFFMVEITGEAAR
jgi:hypothetical protein